MSRPAPSGDLVIVGAGGFGRETAEAVRAMNDAGAAWELRGFLDDGLDPGVRVAGLPVVGAADAQSVPSGARVVVCVGHPGNYVVRRRVVERLGLPPERYAVVVHPTAAVSRSVDVGAGTVLLAGVVATADAVIGRHVAVMPQTVVTHDDVIEDYATFGAGVRLAGGVTVRRGAYVGAGAMVRQGVDIGAWSLVGMGSVVLTDVPAAEVWAGVPARRLRAADVPPDA